MIIEGIILATTLDSLPEGCGSLYPVKRRLLLERCLETMLLFCSHVMVILRDPGEYLYSLSETHKTVSFLQDNKKNWLSSSLFHSRGERVLIMPGQFALIKPFVYEKLLKENAPVVIPAYHGLSGYPIMVDSAVVHQYLLERDSQSFTDFIFRQDPTVIEVDDSGILINLASEETGME